ncbi:MULTISPECIES: stage II sporulation protein M [Mammaliicoccus]|nr:MULTISPECIES: stage II sporulation protein M [Mammaliicoccus]WHI56088.1 stage II sporulation protein M [Mammaliicoccus lentus]WHI58589.1 stage II sporulation protein M [Mammaliicoccus lentus]WHI87337.1 stage II sporulation protein M [Mammaliicoccus lentus]WHI90219.1 stage II sporulation protein M [Mammaliicoccus lentus]
MTKRIIIFFCISISLMLISGIITYIVNPNIEIIKNIQDLPEDKQRAEGLEKVWQYIINNGFKVPLQMLILSIIPIPFLYSANLISTSILTGFVFTLLIRVDLHLGLIGVGSSIPHTVLELLSYAVFAAALYLLNKSIIRMISNLFRKNKKTKISFLKSIVTVAKVYILLVLPLSIIVAFLETYFTNFLMDLLK